uniref:Vacuolar protein sorting-associated protein 11 homolog n=1 Tax=Saccoglossus kowalevskii TaxID=10224 RepID=A0ABM0MQ96_SACKO|nr:PREDICTED: vacuolar protein sorting-associated protein 11 homolog [Saccoglossus kowalevskii]
MAFLQWRRFNFFDKELVKDELGQPFDKLKDINIEVCVSGRGQITIGDIDGTIYFLSRNLELLAFKAYELRVTQLYQLKQHNILVSIGEDEQGINPLIKVWNLEKMDKMGNPTCSRISRAIPSNNKPTPVSTLCVSETLNMMAIGFTDGTVTLIKGDVLRDRHTKLRTIHQDKSRITGLAFKHSHKYSILFIASETNVLSVNITAKDRKHLDSCGSSLHCSVLSDSTQDYQFVMGRSDAVYFYQSDGRGPCLAFEGDKLLLKWYRGYLVVVSKENKTIPRPAAGGATTRHMNVVTVYDIQNKFIAYSSPMPEVLDVLCEWGSLYVLAGDHKLYHLQEKDTQTKLEMLFKKNLYVMAINLAKSQHYDLDGLIDIFTQYGDHLYSKGDHDGAISQYIRTIGRLEPSYVIRKFLDAQRIHNLTAYLQELHKQSLANEDHTTLLLNCYTKLKDNSKLDEFIMTKDKEVDFDVETAIKVCRQASYYAHALFLAEKHGQHDWYLKIQLEDIKDYTKALNYIGKLEFEEAESNLKKYGKILMNEVPHDTTELLKLLCTDYRPSDKPLVDPASMDGSLPPRINKAHAEEFIHIFVNNSSRLTEFLEHMVKVQPSCSSLIYNTLLELHLHDVVHEKEIQKRVDIERKTLDLLQNTEAQYDIDQALVLCQMHNFKAGMLYLYEKAKLYQQILRYHMEHDEHIHIIDCCKRFGQQDPSLWVQALSYFAGKEEDCKPQIMEVLSHIDKKNLLPPLLVIQTLAHNSTATLSVVKDYIVRRLQLENDQIAEDERLIKQYKDETQKMRSQIEELKSSAKIFQVSKCSVCNHPLELPSVHFLCQHSYHQHCFEGYAESESECPACMSENRKVLDIIRAQEHSKDLHEQFHHQLDRATDGFSVVADYFGRGVFNKVTLLTDSMPVKKKPAPTRVVIDPTLQRDQLMGHKQSQPINPFPAVRRTDNVSPFESSRNQTEPLTSLDGIRHSKSKDPVMSIETSKRSTKSSDHVASSFESSRHTAKPTEHVAAFDSSKRAAKPQPVPHHTPPSSRIAPAARTPPVSRTPPTNRGKALVQPSEKPKLFENRQATVSNRVAPKPTPQRTPDHLNPFLTGEPTNPFEESKNPFEQESNNPFEEDEKQLDPSNPFYSP